jgi:hypothetical protein
MAFLDNVVPAQAICDQLQDVAYQDPGSSKAKFAVTNLRIDRDESSKGLLFHVEFSQGLLIVYRCPWDRESSSLQ